VDQDHATEPVKSTRRGRSVATNESVEDESRSEVSPVNAKNSNKRSLSKSSAQSEKNAVEPVADSASPLKTRKKQKVVDAVDNSGMPPMVEDADMEFAPPIAVAQPPMAKHSEMHVAPPPPPTGARKQQGPVFSVSLSDLRSDAVSKLAETYWATKVDYKPSVVDGVYETHLLGTGFALKKIMLLEYSQFLERYLWPQMNQDSSDRHVLCTVLMLNEKHRQRLQPFGMYILI
jgi:hypothetical protein